MNILEDMCMEFGCYEFKIFDSFGDGMTGCDASEGGNGSYVLTNSLTGQVFAEILEADAGFGSEDVQEFCENQLGIEEVELKNIVLVYPNPGKNSFAVQGNNLANIGEGNRTFNDRSNRF